MREVTRSSQMHPDLHGPRLAATLPTLAIQKISRRLVLIATGDRYAEVFQELFSGSKTVLFRVRKWLFHGYF